MAENSSLESTPTWAVAAVCLALVLLALIAEHALHLLHAFLGRRRKKTLDKALHHILAELRSFGFMSLVLSVAQQPISKICIPDGAAESFLPCKDLSLIDDSSDENPCPQGRVPLLSTRGTNQLLLLIFMLAASHVLTSLITFGLMMAKMKKWEQWEVETQSLDYQLSTDPRRFTLARETSFGRRHLKFFRDNRPFLWLGCFIRQFGNSVSKADYLALRHGFIMTHLPHDRSFDFRNFLRRSLDNDFSDVAGISYWSWTYAIIFILSNAHGFYSHIWLPLIPLTILLVVGAKLELAVTRLCLGSCSDDSVLPGTFWVRPDDRLFWFQKPRWILHTIHFIMFQNAFQLAMFVWTWYKFGFPSCYHNKKEEISLSFGVGGLIQILCAYEILPLYALVSRVGSSQPDAIFTQEIVRGLRRWQRAALTRKSSAIIYMEERDEFVENSSTLREEEDSEKQEEDVDYDHNDDNDANDDDNDNNNDDDVAAMSPEEVSSSVESRRGVYNGEASFVMWRETGIELDPTIHDMRGKIFGQSP